MIKNIFLIILSVIVIFLGITCIVIYSDLQDANIKIAELENNIKQFSDKQFQDKKKTIDIQDNNKDSIIAEKSDKTVRTDSIADNNQEIYKTVETDNIQSNSMINKAELIEYKAQLFYVYIVDLNVSQIEFYHKDNDGFKINNFLNLKKIVEKTGKKMLFATNGGIFNKSIEPEGLYIENGKTISQINLNDGNGNFYMKPNGIFYINKWGGAGIINSELYANIENKVLYANQSGPLLVSNFEVSDNFKADSQNKFIRSGVGLFSKSKVVFILSKQQVNFYDFAKIFVDKYNCSDALYLDGYISKMYLPELKLTNTEGEFAVLISVKSK